MHFVRQGIWHTVCIHPVEMLRAHVSTHTHTFWWLHGHPTSFFQVSAYLEDRRRLWPFCSTSSEQPHQHYASSAQTKFPLHLHDWVCHILTAATFGGLCIGTPSVLADFLGECAEGSGYRSRQTCVCIFLTVQVQSMLHARDMYSIIEQKATLQWLFPLSPPIQVQLDLELESSWQ